MSSESSHSDKTVEFKAIRSYKKNVNILNKLGYENTTEFRDLNIFLKEHKLDKLDKTVKANITSPFGRYLISDDHIAASFFSLLSKCNDRQIALHFREMQISDIDNDIGSGIMIDFDIYQESNKNPLDTKNCQELCKSILRCLTNLIDTAESNTVETKIGVIVKPRLVHNKEKNMYKNGIHILIPEIWIAREQKKLFLQNILSDADCQKEFKNIFEVPLSSALDLMCASVPVYLLHNCKEDSLEPYILKELYLYKAVKGNYGFDTSISMDNMQSPFLNMELSLTFKGSSNKKKFYKFKKEFSKRLQSSSKKEKQFTKEQENSLEIFNHFNSYVDENLEYYRTLVMEVLDEKRAYDRKMWRDVVFAIANINKGFRQPLKEIARQFSMRCQEKYESDAFESLWGQAINAETNSGLTFNSIVYWCKEDNAKKFNDILDRDITTIIEMDSFSRANHVMTGSLFQYHFAYYIFHLFKQKFAYDVDGKNGRWYEFVLDNDEHKLGEVYKWRHEIKPDNLIVYISNKLPEIVSKVLEKAELRKKTVSDEEIVKYIDDRYHKLRKSGENLYKTDFKNGIIKEAESLFRRRGFIQSLDESENVMGVANGVLVFSDTVEFVSGYHEHLVSMYSEVAYRPFDINSKETKILLKVIMGMFPDDELDMFHYLMYYLATSLDNKPKDSIFLILQGSGCHGVDSMIKMYDGTNKKVQDIQIGDKLMGDDGTERNVQELFRGEDYMYEIKPAGMKPYIVNGNHIMSVKNTEDRVIDIKLKVLLKKRYDLVLNKEVFLYSSKDKYTFSVKYIKKDKYYGFELDKNHRYLTSDNIVHHNSNGKSSLLELAKTVLGMYGAKISMSVLTEQRGNSGSANEQMMAYKKAHLAFYSETNKQEEINTAVVKELTSQESISSRGIYQSQSIFRPKCNHVITTNYFPVVKTTDYGIWRRMKLYRHKIQFKPKNKIDLTNKYEKLADENIAREFSYNKKIKESFLALLVEYYKDLYKNHGGKISNIVCDTLEKDSLEYRNSMDTLNRFICQNVVVSKGSKVNINEVVEAYSSYLIEEFGKNTQIYKNELKQLVENSELRNFFKTAGSGKIEYDGIRLIDTSDEDERLIEGEYFLKSKKNNSNSEESEGEDMSKFDPLGLNEWFKLNC